MGCAICDFYHASAILHKNKTFCMASFAVKNLRMSLDAQKQSILYSGDSTQPLYYKGLLHLVQSLSFGIPCCEGSYICLILHASSLARVLIHSDSGV